MKKKLVASPITIRFSAEDRKLIEECKKESGVRADSEIVRQGIRALRREQLRNAAKS